MTTDYVIAELPEDSDEPGFEARGAIKELWQSSDFEIMVSGPADCGKTFGACNYIDTLLWTYPGAQGVMMRKTYSALISSAMQTYKRVIGANDPDCPIKSYGGERPQWWQYPNGSRLYCAGLDNAEKVLSTERDFFYLNQAEEFQLSEWETILTRASGRGAVMPHSFVLGDCNPGPPSHWILHRPSLRVLYATHADNPTIYSRTGELLPEGRKRLAVLDTLSGVRYDRLRLGKWVKAEGTVYEGFDRAVNLVPRFVIPSTWRRIRSIDFGFTNPFTCQWWAVDPDGRMYLYREIYMTKRLVSDHAKQIKSLSEGEAIEATVCDHDAEDRATLDSEGIRTQPAWKSISPGIQAVAQRLAKAEDGRARLFVLENSLVEVDEELLAKKQPTCTLDEIETYAWPKGADGKPMKEVPLDANNHAMDAKRYAVAYVDKLGEELPRTPLLTPMQLMVGIRNRSRLSERPYRPGR